MLVVMSCGHRTATSWALDDLVPRFYFTCPICGLPQIIPPENLLSDERVETVEADSWLSENGYNTIR